MKVKDLLPGDLIFIPDGAGAFAWFVISVTDECVMWWAMTGFDRCGVARCLLTSRIDLHVRFNGTIILRNGCIIM